MTNTKATLGAILLGCLLSVLLSGVVAVQTFLYFRMYPKDFLRIKATVGLIWALDAAHATLMCAASWHYLIVNFGNEDIADDIPLTVALTVALTASITFVTHLFFSYRVLQLSKNNWYLATPLIVLTFARLGAALVSTIEMGRLKSFRAFTDDYGYVFTLGLSLSSALDILITCSMGYYLQTSRTGFGGNMDHVIDIIMIHTFNNGALTCVTTVVSMICWLSMPRNLVFLGLHFAISKLYANSLLATLNSRRSLRKGSHVSQPSSSSDHAMPVVFPDSFHRRTNTRLSAFAASTPLQGDEDPTSTKLQISVQKTIHCTVDEGPADTPTPSTP